MKKTTPELLLELHDKASTERDKLNVSTMSYQEYEAKVRSLFKEFNKLADQYRLVRTDFELREIPKYAHRMTLEDFVGTAKNTSFIDSDGTGYYATEKLESNIEIYPSDIIKNNYRKDFPNVSWYNK